VVHARSFWTDWIFNEPPSFPTCCCLWAESAQLFGVSPKSRIPKRNSVCLVCLFLRHSFFVVKKLCYNSQTKGNSFTILHLQSRLLHWPLASQPGNCWSQNSKKNCSRAMLLQLERLRFLGGFLAKCETSWRLLRVLGCSGPFGHNVFRWYISVQIQYIYIYVSIYIYNKYIYIV